MIFTADDIKDACEKLDALTKEYEAANPHGMGMLSDNFDVDDYGLITAAMELMGNPIEFMGFCQGFGTALMLLKGVKNEA